jgi:hypothetical protein
MFEQKIIHQQKEQNRREHQTVRIQEIGLHKMIGNSMRERMKNSFFVPSNYTHMSSKKTHFKTKKKKKSMEKNNNNTYLKFVPSYELVKKKLHIPTKE